MTLREIDRIMAGAVKRIRRGHNERAWLAWHIGQLTSVATNAPKKYPKLETMLSREQKRQSPTELRTAFRAWMARDRS